MTRFVGIDVGAETDMVAVVDESGTVLRKSTAFGEDAAGYRGCVNCLVTRTVRWSQWRQLESTGAIYSLHW